ncbi:MAG: retropepsin-like domain-containing protein [Flavobacteriia bacterium]|nr:retropepsin-like domain-containing protein [Flavobacteriia bacterium]
MIRSTYLLLLSLALTSCGVFRPSTSTLIQRAELVNAPINDTIHAQNRLGLYVVYVKVNDHEEPLEMIFDTGANLTVLTLEAAKRLELESMGGMRLGDSQGQRQSIPFVMLDRLQLGQGVYEDILAAVIDFPENSTITCMAKDGILGYHVIRQLQWAVHPGDTLLVGSTSDLGSGRAYHTVPMEGWKAPLLDVEFKGMIYKNVLFDSGSTGGLDLEMDRISYIADSIPLVRMIDGTSQGVYGNNLDTVLEANNTNIALSGFSLPSDVEYSNNSDRKIGMKTLGRHHIIIDGPAQRLHIGQEEIPHRRSRSLSIIPNLQDTTLYVANLHIGGDADQMGIPLHQRLVSVNGVTGTQMAERECGYLEFILNLRNTDDPLVIELPSGEVVVFEKEELEAQLIDY